MRSGESWRSALWRSRRRVVLTAQGIRVTGGVVGWRVTCRACCNNDCIAHYKQSHVISIRLTPELLDAIRERARADGRSVSGEVVSIVKQQLAATAGRRRKPCKITGWLAHLEVPESHAEFRSARGFASAQLEQRVRAKRPRRKRT